MGSPEVCKICGLRKPKRFCPGVEGRICSICCGTHREVTIACPLECPYLREARAHEKLPDTLDALPHPDVQISESFLEDQAPMLAYIASACATAALAIPGAVDSDLQRALESMNKTYRTLQTGLYFDSLPENQFSAQIYREVKENVDDFARRAAEHGVTLRDSNTMKIFVFLERLGIHRSNGRPKGRSYIDFLRGFFPPPSPERPPESLILQP